MINLKLNINDYLGVKDLMVNEINIDNYKSFIKKHMKKVINNFNMEYKWDLMYSIDDVEYRLKLKHKLFILYFKDIPIGCVWYKQIDENTMYLYNLYVTKTTIRPKFAPIWFVNITNGVILKTCKNITCECEEWNESAQSVFHNNGFSSPV